MYEFVDTIPGNGSGTKSTSVSIQTVFNNVNLDDMLTDENGSFMTLTVSGRSDTQKRIETFEIPGKDGVLEQDKPTSEPRIISIKYKIDDRTNDGFRKRLDKLNSLLEGSKKELKFTDEDAIFFATLQSNKLPEEVSNNLVGELIFFCSDPYKYGPEQVVPFTSDIMTLTNNGTAEADPIFELEVKEPVTFAMIQNQDDEYMMIGKPYDVTQQPYQPEQRVMWDEMNNLTGWTAPSTVGGGTVAGSIRTNGYMFTPSSFGTGSGWHGPALKTSIPNAPLQNFKIDALVEFWNTNTEGDKVGKLEIELLNSASEIVAKLALVDNQFGANVTVGQARAGKDVGANHYLIDEHGDRPGVWNNFYGLLRIMRIGKYWEAYITKISQSTGRHHTSRWRSWTDTDEVALDEVTQVQIYMAQYSNRTPIEMGVHDIKIWKLNQDEIKVPYIADLGDIITFDHKENLILINGEPRKNLKDFGSQYFKLKRGENQLTIMPEDSFDVTCKYRERYR